MTTRLGRILELEAEVKELEKTRAALLHENSEADAKGFQRGRDTLLEALQYWSGSSTDDLIQTYKRIPKDNPTHTLLLTLIHNRGFALFMQETGCQLPFDREKWAMFESSEWWVE